MITPVNHQDLAKRIEESLFTIALLSSVLLNNGAYKGEPDDVDVPPQIDDMHESGIQQAIKILAEVAHSDFCRLATSQGIPV